MCAVKMLELNKTKQKKPTIIRYTSQHVYIYIYSVLLNEDRRHLPVWITGILKITVYTKFAASLLLCRGTLYSSTENET